MHRDLPGGKIDGRRAAPNVSVAIMAHPDRAGMVAGLLNDVPAAKVVWDDGTGRWDTGRRALLAHRPDADWQLVVQDDAVLCRDFLAGVEAALAHAPQVPVSLYTGTWVPYNAHVTPALQAAVEADRPFLAMRGPFWGVAVAIPTSLIRAMVADADRCAQTRNYDFRMVLHFDSLGVECWYTVPSLVNHRDTQSLVPGRNTDKPRVAREWIGDRSPLDIDWSLPPHRVTHGPLAISPPGRRA